VKKRVVAVLVLLAAVVLISPVIVGRMAERTMDDNLNWAASESGEVKITSERFVRGWFSSEGQHRIELLDGDVLTAVQAYAGPMAADELPALIINTHLDHGLIPVSSVSRKGGSLLPGLGSAVSTLQLELPNGEVVDLPGTIYSKVTLGGDLRSNYVLPAGSYSIENATATWGDINVDVTTDPASGEVAFDGTIGALSLGDGADAVQLNGLTFDGKQKPTSYGFAVGDIKFVLDGLTVASNGAQAVGVRAMSVTANTAIDDGDLESDATMNMTLYDIPQFGEMSMNMDLSLSGMDVELLDRMQRTVESMGPTPDPTAIFPRIEEDAKRLFASGFELNFDELNVTLPQGTISSKMLFSFDERDPATFAWTSLLLSSEASIDLSIPEALVEIVVQDNPQAAMAIAGGFLVKQGSAYEMNAELKKGLLTVNGAPIPIPMGLIQ
jgi:uncharacterized protein YdgA (DUF945 family)